MYSFLVSVILRPQCWEESAMGVQWKYKIAVKSFNLDQSANQSKQRSNRVFSILYPGMPPYLSNRIVIATHAKGIESVHVHGGST